MMIKAVAIAILSATLGFVLSEEGYRGKRLFSSVAVLVLLLVGFTLVSEVFSSFFPLITDTGLSDGARCAVKILGAGYVFGVSSDVCRELGESGVANALTTVGRLEIFVTVLPYILEMINFGKELIK